MSTNAEGGMWFGIDGSHAPWKYSTYRLDTVPYEGCGTTAEEKQHIWGKWDYRINPFKPNVPFLYALKTWENLWFSGSIEKDHWAKMDYRV